MRYTPNEKTLFINIKFEASEPRFSSLYLPWTDKLLAIELLELTCEKHERVAGEWDDEVQYDGFIFRDADGKEWHNQYPRAAYGQLDDSQDWIVRSAEVTDENLFTKFDDAERHLEKILRGIRDMEDDYAQALQKHYDEIVAKIEAETPYSVEIKPLKLEFTDGRPAEEHPKIRKVHLVRKA